MSGDVRWREPLRSWVGIVIGILITVPAVGRLVSGFGVLPVNLAILAGGLALLVPSTLLRLDVDDAGLRLWPFRTSVQWDDVDWVEAKGTMLSSLRVHRFSAPRPTHITVQPIGPGRARAVAERLNDRLSASRSR